MRELLGHVFMHEAKVVACGDKNRLEVMVHS